MVCVQMCICLCFVFFRIIFWTPVSIWGRYFYSGCGFVALSLHMRFLTPSGCSFSSHCTSEQLFSLLIDITLQQVLSAIDMRFCPKSPETSSSVACLPHTLAHQWGDLHGIFCWFEMRNIRKWAHEKCVAVKSHGVITKVCRPDNDNVPDVSMADRWHRENIYQPGHSNYSQLIRFKNCHTDGHDEEKQKWRQISRSHSRQTHWRTGSPNSLLLSLWSSAGDWLPCCGAVK